MGKEPHTNSEPDSKPDPSPGPTRLARSGRRRPCVPPPLRPPRRRLAARPSGWPRPWPRPRQAPPLGCPRPVGSRERQSGGVDAVSPARQVCVHVAGARLVPLCPRQPSQGLDPPSLASPALCIWAAAGGGAGRGPAQGGLWGGRGGGRSPFPPTPCPAQGWKRPSTGLVHGGVTIAGWEGGCSSARLHRRRLRPGRQSQPDLDSNPRLIHLLLH